MSHDFHGHSQGKNVKSFILAAVKPPVRSNGQAGTCGP